LNVVNSAPDSPAGPDSAISYPLDVPFEESPDLRTPQRDQAIWRYLDFARFVAMLRSGGLWFARADTLGDEREGSIPAFDDSALGPGVAEEIGSFRKAVRKILYVSCWAGSDGESLAMWNRYSGLTSGVAIRSTVGDLISSIGDLERTLHVAYVDYIDYRVPPTPPTAKISTPGTSGNDGVLDTRKRSAQSPSAAKT
jgi:hypothetical protein